MSRVKECLQGRMDFAVTGLPVVGLNKLRRYQAYHIAIKRDVVSFSVPLVHAVNVQKLVSNFEYQCHENYSLVRGINYLLNHFALCVAALVALIAFCWTDTAIYQVNVVSPSGNLNYEVKTYLDAIGIKKFTPKKRVQNNNLAVNLVEHFPEIAHANLQIKGNTLVVNLAPATVRAAKSKQDFCSRYDAVVRAVYAYSGTAQVEPGDVVRQGDVLVAGAYPDTVAVIGEVTFIVGEEIVRLEISLT